METIANQLFILFQLAVAMFLGGIIGYEREIQNKPAGLRTNMLIAGASAMFVILAEFVIRDYLSLGTELVRSDPIRIIQAIVIGVSFIGGGLIIKDPEGSGENVKYLTTAATTLTSAAVGIAIATELYVIALGIALLTLIINTLIRRFEQK